MEHITLQAPPSDQALKLEDQEYAVLPLVKSRAIKATQLQEAADTALWDLNGNEKATPAAWEAVAKKFAVIIDEVVQIGKGQPKPSKILVDGYNADDPKYTLSNLSHLAKTVIEAASRPTVTS